MSEFFVGVSAGDLPPSVPLAFGTDSGINSVPSGNLENIFGNPPIYSGQPVGGATNIYTYSSGDNKLYISAIINTGLTLPYALASVSTPMAPTNTLYFVRSSLGPLTLTLPASNTTGMAVGQMFIIKDLDGNAAVNNITVNGNGATIDGQSSLVLNQNYQSVILSFTYNQTQFGWAIL